MVAVNSVLDGSRLIGAKSPLALATEHAAEQPEGESLSEGVAAQQKLVGENGTGKVEEERESLVAGRGRR